MDHNSGYCIHLCICLFACRESQRLIYLSCQVIQFNKTFSSLQITPPRLTLNRELNKLPTATAMATTTRTAKSNTFRLAKQHLCTCITLFCSFLWCHYTTYHDVKMPNFTFYRGRERKTTIFFFFLWTYRNSRFLKISPTFRQIKRVRIRFMKFKTARIHFVCNFSRCRCRHRCLSSLKTYN